MVNYHIMYISGAVLMHRTGEVAWEKQLLSSPLERPGNLTRHPKEYESIAQVCPCWQLVHVMATGANILQVEGRGLTANSTSCAVVTAPLNTQSCSCGGIFPVSPANSWQTRCWKRKSRSPYTDAHFVDRSKCSVSHARILV